MQEYDVAWLTARKAVRVLANEGLVEVMQGRGATSSSGDAGHLGHTTHVKAG